MTCSVAGGLVAQYTNLGVPYLLRSLLLGLTLAAAFLFMKDLGFTPGRRKGRAGYDRKNAGHDDQQQRNTVRWLMLAAPFTTGVSIYAFYALQPYLLELYGDTTAFGIAGLAAAIVAGTEILGGLIVPFMRRLFRRRTHVLILATTISIACLALMGLTSRFGVAIAALVIWGLMFSVARPMRQTYVNGIVPSAQRATVLSFDNLMASAGGVAAQPALGRVADIAGYGWSYLGCAILHVAALPFLVLARREDAPSDPIDG